MLGKRRESLLALLAVGAMTAVSGAAVINDGSTAADLTAAHHSTEATATLSSDGSVVNVNASYIGTNGNNYPVVAYESTAEGLVGNTNYTVSADFDMNFSSSSGGGGAWEAAGGVIGWFDPTTGQGIALTRGIYTTEEIDMQVTDLNGNWWATTTHEGLFDSAGAAFTAQDVPTFNYSNPATFSLTFADPAAADLAINPAFTSKITARVQQGSLDWSETFYTTLAAPGEHRVGYYANRVTGEKNTTFSIGDLDNLTLDVVPEPASLALLAVGGLALLGRKK